MFTSNVLLHDFDNVKFAMDEFEILGKESLDVLPKDIKGVAAKTCLGSEVTRYNFTSIEDSPSSVEVAIDPEMLGRVFEALVLQSEESDTGGKSRRHDTGSHYTPRPLVHYLCCEALASWLEGQKLFIGKSDARKRIDTLLALDASEGIDEPTFDKLSTVIHPDDALREIFIDRALPIAPRELQVDLLASKRGIDRDTPEMPGFDAPLNLLSEEDWKPEARGKRQEAETRTQTPEFPSPDSPTDTSGALECLSDHTLESGAELTPVKADAPLYGERGMIDHTVSEKVRAQINKLITEATPYAEAAQSVAPEPQVLRQYQALKDSIASKTANPLERSQVKRTLERLTRLYPSLKLEELLPRYDSLMHGYKATLGRLAKMEKDQGVLFAGKRRFVPADYAGAKNSREKIKDARQQWKDLGTRSPYFKRWFGDWANDPQNASKQDDIQ